MLSLLTSNKVTFNVNVSGTASTPTVRCLVGEHPALSFPATKLSNGEYEVIIDLPAGTRVGAHPFKVEVLLNGRLFTPINYSIDVTGEVETNVVPVVDTAPKVVAATTPTPSAPSPVPMINKITEPEPGPDIPVPEDHTGKKPVALDKSITDALWKLYDPMDMAFPDRGSEVEKLKYLQMLADRKPKKELGGLESRAKAPVSKLKPRAEPAKPPLKKISMLDIANEAEKQAAPKPAAKPAKPATKAKVTEARTQAHPVSLTKGAIIYK